MEYSFENGNEYLREWEMNPGAAEGSHNRMNQETSEIKNEAREHWAHSLLQEAGMKPGDSWVQYLINGLKYLTIGRNPRSGR